MIRGTCRECKYFRRFDRRRFFCTGWVMMLDRLALDNTGCRFWSRMDNNVEALKRNKWNWHDKKTLKNTVFKTGGKKT